MGGKEKWDLLVSESWVILASHGTNLCRLDNLAGREGATLLDRCFFPFITYLKIIRLLISPEAAAVVNRGRGCQHNQLDRTTTST